MKSDKKKETDTKTETERGRIRWHRPYEGYTTHGNSRNVSQLVAGKDVAAGTALLKCRIVVSLILKCGEFLEI